MTPPDTIFPKLGPWHDDAACKRAPEIDFFPNMDDRRDVREAMEKEAKTICRLCPVKDECLAYALKYSSLQGIWGGTNDAERRTMRRRSGTARRSMGDCPECKGPTPTVHVTRGQLECLDCGTRWPPL
jgi:WhiB family redox-sensing transcriptional regulator